ncbi:T9SS type A sorting domain-containing protein [Hyunsoonleella rubra]|uniref:T9SS type A sorting domain-containing protein n=1 Tax=Hyunsoonleella rubra TaxID=1737062 RepID=A0ABW5TBQ0_9FLAO
MKTFILFWLLLLGFWGRSQITSAEYFIDTDPGVGNATALAVSGNTIDQNLNVPTTGLSEGVHKLYIRVLNTDGAWSLYDRNVFYINPGNTNSSNIASAEYFMDMDPGVGGGTSLAISGSTVDQNFNIPTTGLSSGVHKLYLRLINTDGTWSLYDRNVFYVSPDNTNSSNISSAEYFIDTDPGVGSGTALTVSGNTVDTDLTVPTTGLPNGVHKLYVRLVNGDGTWSLYDRNVFYVNPNNSNSANIASAEYFIDTDPGVGNATSLAVSGNVIDQDFNVPTTGLSEGVHKLYLRLINDDGTWSLYDRNVFYVSPDLVNSALITGAEYFFDIDPGVGNATQIDISDAELIDLDLVAQVPADLPDGDHILYIRVQNTDGTWSLYARSGQLSTLSNDDFVLNSFMFYPNPVKDIMVLDTQNQKITDFKIMNMRGQVVLDAVPSGKELNLSSLESGTYLFHLKTEEGSVSKKFVKE